MTTKANPTPELKLIPLDQLQPNPWQTRHGPGDLRELAEDIKVRGILQPPTARPTGNGHSSEGYQLAFGHRRAEAARLAGLTEIPVHVRPIDDQEMANLAAVENAQQKDVSAIETANALARRIIDFKLTQSAAGQPFGLSQSAVANLLRLRELPAEIQHMLRAGTLAERHARQLVIVARKDATHAINIAKEVNQSEDKDKDLATELDKWYEKNLPALHAGGWPQEQAFEGLKKCDSCPARLMTNHYGGAHCSEPECYHEKAKRWQTQQAAIASKKLKIPVASEGETVTLLWDGRTGHYEEAEALLKHPGKDLRVIGSPHTNYTSKQLLGAEHVALASIDPTAAEKLKAEREAKKSKEAAQHQKEAQKNEERRAASYKHQDEYKTLEPVAVKLIAAHLPNRKGLLEFIINLTLGNWQEVPITRELVAKEWLSLNADSWNGGIRETLPTAAKMLSFKIPDGWDKPAAEKPAKPNKRSARASQTPKAKKASVKK